MHMGDPCPPRVKNGDEERVCVSATEVGVVGVMSLVLVLVLLKKDRFILLVGVMSPLSSISSCLRIMCEWCVLISACIRTVSTPCIAAWSSQLSSDRYAEEFVLRVETGDFGVYIPRRGVRGVSLPVRLESMRASAMKLSSSNA
jgi:hypothetical protein